MSKNKIGNIFQETWLDRFLRSWRIAKVAKYIKAGDVVCDLGCGYDGFFLSKIENKIAKGIGFDVEVNDDRNGGKLNLQRLNLDESFPLQGETVDVAVALAVVEHLDNPENFFNESFRVLKKGGIFLLTTPAPKTKPLWEFLVKMRLIQQSDLDEHNRYFRLDELVCLAEKSGFSRVSAKKFQFGFNNLIIAQK